MGWNREVGDVEILLNQVGYDAAGPKRVVLQCRQDPRRKPHRFSVIQEGTSQLLYAGGWERFGRVNEGTDDDWGFYYWRGDLSEFERAGRVLIETEVDGETYRSAVFGIGPDILCRSLVPLVLDYLRRSRNTARNGVLEGEERYYEVGGAWFELGDHGGTLMRDAWKVLWALAQARERNPFLEALREEMLYGSLWWKRIMIHYPRTGRIISGMGGWGADEGRASWYEYPCGNHQHEKLMSLALYLMLFRHLRDSGFLKRAEKMWQFYRDWITSDRLFSVYHETGGSTEWAGIDYRSSWPAPGRNVTLVDDAAFLFGDVEMFRQLKQRVYLEHAQELVDRLLTEAQDSETRSLQWNNFYDHLHATSLAYFAAHVPDDPRSQVIKRQLKEFFDELTRDAEAASPFGIARKNFAGYEAWRPRGRLKGVAPGFFHRTGEGLGLNLQYGLEAWQALWVNRVVPKPQYRRFAQAHIDWILGLNPRGLCMMKGAGSVVPPMGPGGAFDGCVCHGLVSDGRHDRPWLGTWHDPEADAQSDTIARHKVWAQCEARLGGAASLLMALSMT
jgi:hypothetical protein